MIAAPAVRDLPESAIDWELPAAPVSDSGDVLTEAVIDGLSFRLMVQVALDQIRQLTIDLARERRQRLDLQAECRRLRARLLAADGVTP